MTRSELTAIPEVSDSFGYWFSGFVDGEGNFLLMCKWQSSTPNFPVRKIGLRIQIRKDDLPALEYIRDNIGGGISDEGRYCRWATTTASICAQVLVPLFDKYPLHSKKAKEFSLWRECALEHYRLWLTNSRNHPDREIVNQMFRDAQEAISETRMYEGR